MLSQVYQVGQPGEGDLQAGGQQGGVPAVGAPQEQAGHELRDYGPGSQVRIEHFFLVVCDKICLSLNAEK